ncbi:MAG TPA: 5'-nucleotidase C-terminal domain-containing protein [Polyangia bacterium]|nr:5'-nucleotidase C-terminal domain-containing protein [Polyangia bacterium]
MAAVAATAMPGCRRSATPPVPAAPPAARVTISLVGTNDLHGRLEALPPFGGYLGNLRRARARDGGGVLLVDAGDMFQGTLPSNLNEGAAVVRAYNALGYAAAALGNHEFDFGPAGPAVTAQKPTDDPRGALRARAAEATFPFLDANLVDAATGAPPAWSNVVPDVLLAVAGIKVGIVGVATMSTPRTTLAANFAGLGIKPLAPAIAAAATELHRKGATVVIAAAHAGGVCKRFDAPEHFDSCEADGEIFQVARELTASGAVVDAIVAGHTHEGVAHRVSGIPIVEAFANGHDFSRIDLTIDRATGRAIDARIFPPQRICAPERCAGETYEGAPVVPDAAVAAAIAPALEAARAERERSLGVVVTATIKRAQKVESPLGNLFADLMRAARPRADVALTNGGGLRADLPPGPLTYGRLFEALPFDNRFATIPLTAAELAEAVLRNLGRDNGIVSLSGVRAEARCEGGALVVHLFRPDGRPIPPKARLTLVTSDFLATGGDGLFSEETKQRAKLDDGPPIRDAMADLLAARKTPLTPDDPTLFDPARPRIAYRGLRPVECR